MNVMNVFFLHAGICLTNDIDTLITHMNNVSWCLLLDSLLITFSSEPILAWAGLRSRRLLWANRSLQDDPRMRRWNCSRCSDDSISKVHQALLAFRDYDEDHLLGLTEHFHGESLCRQGWIYSCHRHLQTARHRLLRRGHHGDFAEGNTNGRIVDGENRKRRLNQIEARNAFGGETFNWQFDLNWNFPILGSKVERIKRNFQHQLEKNLNSKIITRKASQKLILGKSSPTKLKID